MEVAELKTTLLSLRGLGYSPFPILCYVENGKREKKPVVAWQDFQNRQPTDDEIEKWCANPSAKYYGICISTEGMCVVDLDHEGGAPSLAELPDDIDLTQNMWTRTGGGGLHIFYRNDIKVRNKTNIFGKNKGAGDTAVDLRADGGLIVIGSSEVWSHNPKQAGEKPTVVGSYRTENLRPKSELPELPPALRAFLVDENGKAKKLPKITSLTENGPVKEGERNEMAASLAWDLVSKVWSLNELKENKTVYWKLIEKKFKNWEDSRDEYQSAWDSAYRKIEAKRPKPWPEQANVVIQTVRKEVKENLQYESDLNEWGLAITDVTRIGEIFKFKLADGASFEVEAVDIYSQAKFRSAYTFGTSKMLKLIRPKSYEKFILSLAPTDLVDSGTSLKNVLDQLLQTQLQRSGQSDTEEQAEEMITASSWALFGKRIYFKTESLSQAHPSLGRIGQGKIVSALQDIGAKQKKNGNIKYWVYGTP